MALITTSLQAAYSGTDASSKFSYLSSLGSSVTFSQADSDTNANGGTSGFDSGGGDVYGTLSYVTGGTTTTVAGRISGKTNDGKGYVFTFAVGGTTTNYLLLKNGVSAYATASATEIQYNSSFNNADLTAFNSYFASNNSNSPNNAPTVANLLLDRSATEGSAFSYQFAANSFSDVDAGTVLTYTASLSNGNPLPGWLSFDSSTRTFSGTPNTSGTISVKVTASDGAATADDVFDIAIAAAPAPDPGPPPPVQLDADLNLNSNTGASNDRITSDIQPDFDINAGKLLSAGQTARLLDASGKLVSATTVTTEQVSAGKVTLPTPSTLDDGTYTYTAQILDTTGRVIGERLITIQIVTDKDGVMPSVELAANGGDFNKDGIPDWQQANVTQLPLKSLSQFLLGKDAQKDSFGAVLVGAPDLAAQGGIQLNASAQLVDVKLVDTPASKPLPTGVQATSAMFAFTVQAQDGATLPDANARAGLQVQTVIALPQGVKADAFMKFNPATQAWVNYANPRALTGAADGAALLDTNGDGLIDRIVVTVTDGGPGDEDGLVNGIVVDPGLLADTGTSSSLVSLKDRDGVAADVERATANHDYNQDGIEDWDQGAIAQLPLASMDAYLQGKDAPLASFGTVMVGKYDSTSPISAKIDANGQLLNVAVAPVGKAAPTGFKAVSPVLEVKAAAADGAASLTDIDPTREGLQTQVIQYFTTGVKANAFLLFDAASRTWFDYSDPTSIDGSSDGAALLDFNKDGLVDAAVITITDSGVADDDLTINGVISLHGMLGWYGV